MVSPTKTGFGVRISSRPRFANACWLTSGTDKPVTIATVSVELTSSFLYGVPAA
jgi:hypothetical protein